MKVKIKKLPELSKIEMSVVFTKEEYNAEYEKQFEIELSEVKEPGFRPGKYPRSMYMKKYGDARVQSRTIDALINNSYYEALDSKKVQAVGQPKIDLIEKLKDDEWGYKAVVSVFPEVEAKDYYGIEATKEEVNVTDEDVEKEVTRNLKQKADLEVKEDGVIENGDTVVFDFVGTVDGVEFEGGKAENYELEIGSGRFIPGFEDQMLGMKTGEEKVLKVTFPEQYTPELKGKDAEFKVLVHEIKVCVLPELNDEYVKGLEIENVETVEAWKAFLKENLITDRTEASNNKFEDDVFTKLLENNPVVIPDELIDAEVQKKVDELSNTANQYGIPLDYFLKYQGIDSIEQYKELVRPGVKTNIQYEVIMYAIVKQEKIKLTKEDYDKYYEKLANGKDVKEVKEKYSKEKVTEYFKLLKSHDLVLSNVK